MNAATETAPSAPVLTLVTDTPVSSPSPRKPGAKRNKAPGPKVYKNARGEGWVIRYKYRDAAGNPVDIKQKAKGSTKTAAIAEARAMEREVLDKMFADPAARPAAPSLAEFVPRFLDYCTANEKSPATVRSYSNHLRIHVIPAIGDRRLDSITPADLESVKAACARLGVNTRRQVIATLNRVLSVATLLDVARNLPRAVQLKRAPVSPTAYSPEDVEHLLTACESDRDRAFVYLAFHGGLRRGEVIAVRGEDFEPCDDGALVLNICRSVWEFTIKPPKSGKSREINLEGAAATALRAHMSTLADPRGYLFPAVTDRRTAEGEPLPADDTAFIRVMERLCKDAGVKFRATHVLRKTGATAMAKGGASVYEISEFLGHAGVEMARHYVDREQARRSRSRAASMIAGYTAPK